MSAWHCQPVFCQISASGMLHVNANHSAAVSGFPAALKHREAGRNTLAFTKDVTAPNAPQRRTTGEICNLILGSR